MDFWDKYAKLYDAAESLNGKVYREMCELTTRLTPFHANVLECAGGTGALSFAAAVKAERVLCTDNSPKMLGVAAGKARKRGFLNVEFEKRSIFRLDDPDETYDVVIAGNVLHLLNAPEKAVQELARVTKRGGKILLPTFTLADVSKASSAILALYKKLGFDPSENYSPETYLEMLKRCGCGAIKAKVIEGKMPCCYAVIIRK